METSMEQALARVTPGYDSYCWRAPDGRVVETCTILTTTANQRLRDVHDRMPLILSPVDYDLRLDQGFRDVAAANGMLRPFDAGLMRRYFVSAHVNSVANDDPKCSEPIESLSPGQTSSLLNASIMSFREQPERRIFVVAYEKSARREMIGG